MPGDPFHELHGFRHFWHFLNFFLYSVDRWAAARPGHAGNCAGVRLDPLLAHEGPTISCCDRFGRAAARPYPIGSGRDDLPVVRVFPEGFFLVSDELAIEANRSCASESVF